MSLGVPASTAAQTLLGGRFLVEREVGRGGVGIVYRARDQMSGQLVALKVIAITGVDAGEEARFAREGRVLAGLSHPGIVRVVAFGQLERHEERQPYIAMEWLEGQDLSERLKRQPLDLASSLIIGAEIAEALAAAHAAGIVHRDVKPSNILLVPRVEVAGEITAKLVDFGVASAEDVKLTRTGAILGTPAYMAPEQARGDGEVTAQADLYALGATLFEMVTGRAPHVGPTPIAILARLVTMAAPSLSELLPDVPPALDALVGELLATAPEERPASALLVAERLRGIARDLGARSDAAPPTLVPSLLAGALERIVEAPPPSSRVSLIPVSQAGSHGTGSSRLITSILATRVPKGAPRARILTHLRARGADATELGGDAIIAHLGTRQALGDEATRALELGQRLAQLNAQVGIATGRTKLARARPTGEVVDRAAALSRDAQRGQVLADTTTSELARGKYEFQLRSDGTAVVGAALRGGERAGGGAPFVGREAEMAQLVQSFQRSSEDETPVVVTITGPPGIGKTRLRREALSNLAALPDAPRSVHVRCDSFAKGHALGVVADIARALAGLPKNTSLADARAAASSLLLGLGESGLDSSAHSSVRVQAAAASSEGPGGVRQASAAAAGPSSPISQVSPARERLARLMANEALEVDGDHGARDAVWIALTDMLVNVASRGPLAIAIEDAQWADPDSLAWLDHVLARAAGKPLWIMLTTRPTLWRDEPSRFSGRDHVRIELRPLSRRTVRTIARTILAERAEGAAGDALTESIADQAAGSPLFAEELSRLAAAGKDATRAATIEAAIQVHLDALDDAGRDAAARLSVFGMNGWDAGMEALGVAKASEVLRSLAGVEVLVEQAESRFKEMREWGFKHALMREVAYASLGEDALKMLHALAGQWLANVGEDDAIVARHLELGGESVLASGYLEKAARRALATNALSQAVDLAERALAFAEDKPTQFARAQLLDEAWSRLDARAGERDSAVRAMQDAIFDTASDVRARGARVRYEDACGGDGETSARLEQVRKDAQSAELYDEEARCAAALAARYAYAGQMDKAAEVADELLALAREHGIAGAAVDAWQTLAVVRQSRGDVGPALEARREAAKSARAASLKTREATLTINVGFALTTVGAKEDARTAIEDGLALAQAVGSPGTVRHGQMNLLCWTATFGADGPEPAGDRTEAGGSSRPRKKRRFEALLDEPRQLADSAVSGSWVPHDRATLGVLFYRGLELLRSDGEGHAERARTLLRTAADGYRATGMLDVVPVAIGFLAEAELRCGDFERARESAASAAKLLDDGHPSLLNEAPIFLALHGACVATDDRAEAIRAIARGVPHLMTRIAGLARTPYAFGFLTNLVPNAGLIAAAQTYDLVPPALAQILEDGRG